MASLPAWSGLDRPVCDPGSGDGSQGRWWCCWLEAESEQTRRQFWLMPLMHSGDIAVQEAALPLFERFSDPRTADFACRLRDVIARFGRIPHRNTVLGRVSSAEELAFLQTAGSRF